MRVLVRILMISNSLIFFFGAVQHAGVAIGRWHEPHIVPAAIVESICGFFLLWGSVALAGPSGKGWGTALVGNLVAIGGVLLGMAALAAGRGPRTGSNELYHHIMLALAGASVLLLFLLKSMLRRS